MSKLKIGMVGIGFIADWHFQGFEANPDASITGICRTFYGSPVKQKEQKDALFKKANDFGIKAYTTFDEMVKDDAIDAIIIGSINPEHFEQIQSAFDHGKHMMVEKPVVTQFDQLDTIRKKSRETGIRIFPAHNFVYRNAVRKAKEIITAGKLGKIIHSSFVVTHTIGEGHSKGWRSVKNLGTGGTLIDSGHHLVYQTLYLLGKPSRLHGFTSTNLLTHMECEDTAQVSLSYPDGSMAVVMQSWTSDHAGMINGIRIFGTEGSIVISDGLYFNDEKIDTDVEYPDSFKNQAKAFTDYILHDVPPLSDLQDVEDTLKITFGAYESNDNNKVIEF